MDQTVTSRAFILVVVICCGLVSIDQVTTLPLKSCSSIINHVQSRIAAAQPLHADDLSLYFTCSGVQQQWSDDELERQLLAVQPSTDGRWPSSSRVVCTTVDCLGRRAALTFEPCLRLSPRQCLALVGVLENIISTTNSDVDNDDAAGHMLEYFRQFADNQKWRPGDDTRQKLLADTTVEKTNIKRDRDTGSLSKSGGGNGRYYGKTSSLVSPGASSSRIRRSMPQGIPFALPERMTPEARAIVASYLAWRAQNGYGKISGRWG